MADYLPAGNTCYAPVQTLMAQWLIYASNGLSADADATEAELNALGASMTGA